MKKIMQKLLTGLLLFSLLFSPAGAALPASAESESPPAACSSSKFKGYYYAQLSEQAKRFYAAIDEMYRLGRFFSDSPSYDLLTHGVLTVSEVRQAVEFDSTPILASFSAARDAWFFDRSDVFCADPSRLLLRFRRTFMGYAVSFGAESDTLCPSGKAIDTEAVHAMNEAFKEALDALCDDEVKRLEPGTPQLLLLAQKLKEKILALPETENSAAYARTAYGALCEGSTDTEAVSRACFAAAEKLDYAPVLAKGYRAEAGRYRPAFFLFITMNEICYGIDIDFFIRPDAAQDQLFFDADDMAAGRYIVSDTLSGSGYPFRPVIFRPAAAETPTLSTPLTSDRLFSDRFSDVSLFSCNRNGWKRADETAVPATDLRYLLASAKRLKEGEAEPARLAAIALSGIPADQALSAVTYRIDLSLDGQPVRIPEGGWIEVGVGLPPTVQDPNRPDDREERQYAVYGFSRKANGEIDPDTASPIRFAETDAGLVLFLTGHTDFTILSFPLPEGNAENMPHNFLMRTHGPGRVFENGEEIPLLTVEPGKSVTLDIRPEDGNVAESAFLGTQKLTIRDGKVTIPYAAWKKADMLSVCFISRAQLDRFRSEGSTPVRLHGTVFDPLGNTKVRLRALSESPLIGTKLRVCLEEEVLLAPAYDVTVSYQWYRDGVPIPEQTGDTFEIPKTVLKDSGTYRIAVTYQRENGDVRVCMSDDLHITVLSVFSFFGWILFSIFIFLLPAAAAVGYLLFRRRKERK